MCSGGRRCILLFYTLLQSDKAVGKIIKIQNCSEFRSKKSSVVATPERTGSTLG